VATQRVASTIYIAFMSAFVLMALLLKNTGGDLVIGGGYNQTAANLIDKGIANAIHGGQGFWNSRFWCAPKHPHGWIVCCEDTCGGVFSVYRFSFALCLFFAGLTVCTMGTTKFGARVHRGFWLMKAATLFALLLSTLFIDNHAMEGYREAARYLSVPFLLMQILLLIDFGYSWNESWLKYDEACESESCVGWRLGILASAALLYIGSLAGWIVLYTSFGHDGCPAQQALISINLVVSVALTIVSCTKIAPHGTILTSAVVTGYTTYLSYSALASHPDSSCNPFAARDENSVADLLVGLLVAAISMAGTAMSVTSSKEQLMGKEAGSDLTTSLEAGPSSSAPKDEDDVENLEPESWWYYHFMMVACSLYMAMLLSDWSSEPAFINGAPATHEHAGAYATSLGSFWVKVISQWVCLLMYAWTLLAPYLLRDYRDFGIEFDLD